MWKATAVIKYNDVPCFICFKDSFPPPQPRELFRRHLKVFTLSSPLIFVNIFI